MDQSNLSINTEDIRKNGYGFSFLSTVVSLVNNRNFKSGEFDIYKENSSGELIQDTKESYIWRTLSAVSEQIGGVLQENVTNFIDNVANIELCKVKALQSMSEFTGTRYSVFQNIIDFPRELLQLMDILSIKREYLVNALKVHDKFVQQFAPSVQASSDTVYQQVYDLSTVRNEDSRLSSNWASYYNDKLSTYIPYQLSTSKYIDDQKLDETISGIYRDFLVSKLEQTYNDKENTIIWQKLSTIIQLSNFQLPNSKQVEIDEYKLRYNVDKDFNVENEYDKIESGISVVTDYTKYEQHLFDLERERRSEPYKLSSLQTKNKYYREADVREYYKFVQNEYVQLCSIYLSADEYPIDNTYMQIDEGKKDDLIVLTGEEYGKFDYRIDPKKIDQVVNLITRLTSELRSIREQIKVICQKNCMKGTYVLITYIINEYLKNNLRYSLSSVTNIIPDFEYDKNGVDFIEYVDPTEYYNISTDVDDESIPDLNARYWASSKGLDAIGAIDSTNIFQQLPTLDSNNFAFSLDCIENFYLQMLQSKFKLDPDKDMPLSSQQEHLHNFLNNIFDIGADSTYREHGQLCSVTPVQLSSEKADMFYSYMGLSDSAEPYCNIKNQRHPSYQIHPYLSNFMEYYDYSYPVENTVNMAVANIKELLRNNLTDFIDLDGYLTKLWYNPLNSNSDYQSRYETVSHIDVNNQQNQLYGYDGLFYPSTLSILEDRNGEFDKFIQSIRDNKPDNGNQECGYYGLDLTDNDREFIISQLTTFKDIILSCAKSPYDISRYGMDIYGNNYILVKNLSVDGIDNVTDVMPDVKRGIPGVLWIKLKNHPLAFPAYVMRNSSGRFVNMLSESQCFIEDADDEDANQAFISELTRYKSLSADYGGYDLYTPAVYDFQFSNDKTYMIIDVVQRKIDDDGTSANWPLTIAPLKQYAKSVSIKRHVLKLTRLNGLESLIGKIGLQFLSGMNNYKPACWYSDDAEFGVLYWELKRDEGLVNIIICGYNLQNTDGSNVVGGITPLKAYLDKLPFNDDIKFDFYAGGKDNNKHLIFCYVADRPANSVLENMSNYQHHTVNYDSLPDNFTKFSKQVMTQDFIITPMDAWSFSLNRAKDHVEHYLPYSDCGFNPIHTGVNDYGNTKLAQKEQRQKRGITKFQVIGNALEPSAMIDFKFVVPVRMYDNYRTNTALSAAELQMIHFGESESEAKAHEIHLGSDAIYDPVTFKIKIKTSDLALNVDEEYVNFITNYGYRDNPVDDVVEYPYVWTTYDGRSGMQDIPDKYVYALSSCPELAWKDTNVLQTSPSRQISVSFGHNRYSPNDIQLDFNSYYFFGRTKKDDQYFKNIFNRKHLFLNLDKPGAAGWLYTYESDNTLKVDAKYYIKNISDNQTGKIKFILSAFFETEDAPIVEEYLLGPEINTPDPSDPEKTLPSDTTFDIVYNDNHYDLAVQK